jgi:hypothetical protein
MVEDVDANATGAVRVTMQWFQLLLAWFSQIRWRSLCKHAQLIKLHTEHTLLSASLLEVDLITYLSCLNCTSFDPLI